MYNYMENFTYLAYIKTGVVPNISDMRRCTVHVHTSNVTVCTHVDPCVNHMSIHIQSAQW